MAKKVRAANVDVVLKDLASIVDQMWGGEIGGIKASVGMGFLHLNSCFLINTRLVESSQLENAKEALRKFGGYLVSPNPVGQGFELWIIPKWWKNPYK